MTKDELLYELETLSRYSPKYTEEYDSDCPCCYQPGGVEMESDCAGDYLTYADVRALLNRA